MKLQYKFFDIFDHNKCPSSEKEDEKCILRQSYFHQIQPSHDISHEASPSSLQVPGSRCPLQTLYSSQLVAAPGSKEKKCSSHGTSNLSLSCSRLRASSRVKQGARLLVTSLLWNLLALSSWLSTQHTRIPDLGTVITLVTGGL